MKVSALIDVLARYVDALEAACANDAADSLRAFVGALTSSSSMKMSEFVKLCSEMTIAKSDEVPVLADLVPVIEGLGKLLEGMAKAPLLADLNLLKAVAHERREVSISIFVSAVKERVASASRPRSKRGEVPVNQQLVDGYLKRLEANLGNDIAFRALFRDLEADERVTKIEAIELATRFLGPTPPSTTRARALQRVLLRHQKIVDFRRASESIRGRQPVRSV